jgi:hypothetical protein
MAYRTWATGETITASLLNAQSPTLCTSGTRPSGGNLYEGVLITETDTDRVLYYDGTGWIILAEPDQSWAPTFAAGVTVGNGSWSFSSYHRNDGWLDYRGRFVLGSTSAITADVRLNLPIAASGAVLSGELRCAFYRSSSGVQAVGIGALDGTTGSYFLRAVDSAGASAISTGINGTAPFGTAFTNADVIDVYGRYRMTTRYS